MAIHAPITGAPIGAPDFKLNGVSFLVDEPYPFLDQAHALACCLDDATSGHASPNSDILNAAARGIATLIHLASIGLDVMEQKQRARA